MSYTVNGISALANINEFVDTAKLLSLIKNFNIDDAKTFVKAIGNCFPQQVEKEDKNKETKYDSKYQILDFSEFGVKILLRVSDHNINAFNIQDDVDEAYSIVVKHKKSKNTFVNRDDITVREYVYWEENCDREKYLKIAKNIYKFLDTSEWDEDYVKADAVNPERNGVLGMQNNDAVLMKMKAKALALYAYAQIQHRTAIDDSGKQSVISFSMIPIRQIHTDTVRFQNRRNAYSEDIKNRIVDAWRNGSFDWQKFDPITVWMDNGQNKLFVLSGHSRLAAFREIAQHDGRFAMIPARTFVGSEEQAVDLALNSNTLSTKETDSSKRLKLAKAKAKALYILALKMKMGK